MIDNTAGLNTQANVIETHIGFVADEAFECDEFAVVRRGGRLMQQRITDGVAQPAEANEHEADGQPRGQHITPRYQQRNQAERGGDTHQPTVQAKGLGQPNAKRKCNANDDKRGSAMQCKTIRDGARHGGHYR